MSKFLFKVFFLIFAISVSIIFFHDGGTVAYSIAAIAILICFICYWANIPTGDQNTYCDEKK